MGKKKTANDYSDLIKQSHNQLYKIGVENNQERIQYQKKLKRQLKAWSDLIMVMVYVPGNEQNPWTFDELGFSVKQMELKKKKSDYYQTGDYHVKVCIQESTDTLPAIWEYLDVVVERKGGPRTKKSVYQFNWDAVVMGKHYSNVFEFISNEFKLSSFIEDDVQVMDPKTVFIANINTAVTLSITSDNKKLVVTCMGKDPVKYNVRRVRGSTNIYKTEYKPGKGGPHDLYGSLYGSTTLKDGSVRSNRDRLHDEIKRFKKDDRFNMFWLFAECDRSKFMAYRPLFKGKERNEGFGANVASRKASIESIAYEMGSPVNWCGSRQGAIDDFKNMVYQAVIHDYVRLLGL